MTGNTIAAVGNYQRIERGRDTRNGSKSQLLFQEVTTSSTFQTHHQTNIYSIYSVIQFRIESLTID